MHRYSYLNVICIINFELNECEMSMILLTVVRVTQSVYLYKINSNDAKLSTIF